MTTLAEHIIVAGAEIRPSMLEKSMYDSWASRIRLFIKGKKNDRMMLDSIVEAQQLQNNYDVQATNIILHGLPPNVYSLVNHQEETKQGEDLIDYINKAMAFLSTVASSFSDLPTHSTRSEEMFEYILLTKIKLLIKKLEDSEVTAAGYISTTDEVQIKYSKSLLLLVVKLLLLVSITTARRVSAIKV
ncbi:hypothetical protein Tco_1515729 [Tanacetum coccineum]